MIVTQALAQLWEHVSKMETQTKINLGFTGIILVMIAGFSTYVVLDDEGTPLNDTHYCESRNATMYCARTTAQYCRPSMTTTLGSKQCIEGWKLIPEKPEINHTIKNNGSVGIGTTPGYEELIISSGSGNIHCTSGGCE